MYDVKKSRIFVSCGVWHSRSSPRNVVLFEGGVNILMLRGGVYA